MKQENRDRIVCAMGVIRALKNFLNEPMQAAIDDATNLLGAVLQSEEETTDHEQ